MGAALGAHRVVAGALAPPSQGTLALVGEAQAGLRREAHQAHRLGGPDGHLHAGLAPVDAAGQLPAAVKTRGALTCGRGLTVGGNAPVLAGVDDGQQAGQGPGDQAVVVMEHVLRQSGSFRRNLPPADAGGVSFI